jgi:GPI-anchor transamidase subunit K
MVREEQSWSKQIVGAVALAGCAAAWAAGTWLES